jgi:acetolactate synthase I/II/III large subunit
MRGGVDGHAARPPPRSFEIRSAEAEGRRPPSRKEQGARREGNSMTRNTDDKLRGWQSDIIVDLIKRYEFEYISMNPGASFRGLHDSIVNYGKEDPPMLLCQHEEIAVQIAHGYAKASGKPMAVILHNLVGLLHATMAIYYAYIDRVPIFIMGATGPMDEGKRRPHIDWTHTALVQGNAIRDYVKWDYQPYSIDGVPESFARAFSVMTTEPQGPVYMCYDADLQEQKITREIPLPPIDSVRTPSPMMPDPRAIEAIADKLLACENPLLMPEYVGRREGGFDAMVKLAETIGAGVWDINNALNFPNQHPLSLSLDKGALKTVDVVLGLDCKDVEKATRELNSTKREVTTVVADHCDWLEMGFAEINMSKWSMDYCRMQPCSIRALGDTSLGIPALTKVIEEKVAKDPALKEKIRKRTATIAKRHDETWAKWQEEAKEDWDAAPMTVPRLAHEVWDVIKDEDWVLTANTLKNQVRKMWNFDKPYRHPGVELGTSTQIGMSIGVALAHKKAGRIVVDLQPDGDLMFDAGALWVAAKYEIPMLIVMYNNRAYYNDWEHQIRMARLRGTDLEKAHIGMDLFGPEPDFGALARSMGVWGEGPIEDPKDVRGALDRALAVVKSGKPALVDTITRHR